MKQLFRYDFLTRDEVMSNPWKTVILSDCLGMYDWAMSAKYFLNKGVSAFFILWSKRNSQSQSCNELKLLYGLFDSTWKSFTK